MSNGHVTPPEVEVEESQSQLPPSLPTSGVNGEGGRAWIIELESRGVSTGVARSLVAEHSANRIDEALAWFDEQRPGSVGPGVLVIAIGVR